MELSFIVLLTTLLGLLKFIESHEHPRRHRHSFRKGHFLENMAWDDKFHTSYSGNKLLNYPGFDDLDKWTKSKTKADKNHHEVHLKRITDQENYFSDRSFSKYMKNFEKNSLTFSKHFLNKTFEVESLGQNPHEDDHLINESSQKERNGESFEEETTDNKNEPEQVASKTKDISTFNDDTFLSAPRWTLKYQGIVSEQALNNTQRNITASVGGNAFLPCKVGHLGDRQLLYNFQISWIRRRDWHVLTSGKILYTYDERFSVLHEPGSQDWTLHIKWVNMKDPGTYECQVSTGTGIISLFVNLKVVIPKAFIPGHGQYHVNKGSSISLKCYIKNSPSPPQYILWHHNGELLNFLRNRPDVVIADDLSRNKNQFVFTSRNVIRSDLSNTLFNEVEETPFVSQLSVELAKERHSGNYTCSAPNTDAASTLVFITEGDKTAAVQRIDSAANRFLPDKNQSLFLEIFFFVFLKISSLFT